MRRYELMLLLRPDLEDDKLQSAVEKVTRAIVNGGGSLSKVSPWGKRRLAYPIQHLREASYFLIHFDIEPGAVREIERGMLISEEILRHLVTVIEDRGAVDEIEAAAGGDDAMTDGDDAEEAFMAADERRAADEPDGEAAEATPEEPSGDEPAADATEDDSREPAAASTEG
jgi:small subunit ribosomal protein S6